MVYVYACGRGMYVNAFLKGISGHRSAAHEHLKANSRSTVFDMTINVRDEACKATVANGSLHPAQGLHEDGEWIAGKLMNPE